MEKEPVADPGPMEEMAIIFYNTRLLLLDIHENFYLADPVFVYAIGYLDAVIRKIMAYRRLRKQKKLAFVSRLSQAIQYWVVPLTPGSMKNRLWYQKMNRKSDVYDSVWDSQIPLILLSHQLGVLNRSETPTRALLKLQAAVQVRDVAPLKLMVEHHGLTLEARTLGHYFQQQFPHCDITIVDTSLYLGNEWGPFMGVVVLYP